MRRGYEGLRCWVCGGEANSREHDLKRSDIDACRADRNHLFKSDKNRQNKTIQSSRSDALKFRSPVCAFCNNTRFQPYDKAWEQFSASLRKIDISSIQQIVRVGKLFPDDPVGLLNKVHVFFTKWLGCSLVEAGCKFDPTRFQDAILDNVPHPNVHLIFSVSDGQPVNVSDLIVNLEGEKIITAGRTYTASISVQVLYVTEGRVSDGLRYAWHPNLGSTRIRLVRHDCGDANEDHGDAG